MAHDVFVSYASEDKTVADAVCGTLEANGVRCWIAPRDVIPGQPYGEAIIEAIHGCRIMVLIFSSHANASGHIPKEIERAVSKGVTIMPFRIEGVTPGKSLDYFIGSVHWLDALAPPLEGHLQKLSSPRDKQAARAELHYRVEQKLRDASVVRVALVTGLQNQIRVQFSATGHPVIGDRKYHPEEAKEKKIDRVALHAVRLEFTHPRTGKQIAIDCPVPRDIEALIRAIGGR